MPNSSVPTRRLSRTTFILAMSIAVSAWSQQVPIPAMIPPLTPPKPSLTRDEAIELKATFDAISKEEREEMKAYYAELGVDLGLLFGGEATMPGGGLLDAVKATDFARNPRAVLAARSKLGFGTVARPDASIAPPADVAKWLHLHVMAGEWDTFRSFLASRPQPESEGMFTHILQSINKGDPGLLPEEVLAIAETCPGEIKDWQVEALAQLLKTAAGKFSTGPMLAQIKNGTRLFGNQDEARQKRTVDFLAGAGLVTEAHAYLPSLDVARGKGDAQVIIIHGRYHTDLASATNDTPTGDRERLTSWGLFTEASLMSGATTGVRQDAMRRAMDLMQSVPPSHVKEWMAKVFSSDSLGPAALEIIAIKAMSMRDLKLDVEQRAQAILTMKEAVDTLLSGTTVDAGSLRVPLRMLTTALVGEIETTVTDKGRDRTMARETELLLRALPSDRWLDMIEPSLSTRASKASIAISMIASKSEQAIAILAGALKRAPDQATDLADHFLVSWEARLNPKNDRSAEDEMFMYGWRPFVPAAPLTRGRQRRNLDRLNELLAIVQEFGVDSRQLPSVTAVFKACHSKTEVYFRGDIEHVFGPVVAIAPSTAFALAEGMRTSLNGDWRNREAQKAAGINRSANEIAALVDKGYGLAIELIDRALAEHPASWRYASSKAALSYERLQFKQTQQKQDASTYDAYRKDAFLAFAGAAAQYARVIERGEEREDPGVYVNWFAAAIGSSELNYLNRDDILVEGTKQTDQVDLIRAAILSLPSDSTDRHLSAFARAVEAGVGRAQPEMKPRVVKHALRVIADHPSGATLRSMDELYRDLLKGEIRLRLTVDGDDHVGVARSFGALLSLRYTNAVDRETGGFAKYLQNNVWGLVGGQYRSINYRDQLQKSIESAFKDSFDVEGIGFFEAFTPGRSVSENGEDGWQEKPLAYLVLKRKDPSIDRTPTLTMDMYFADQTGPVTLAVQCNTPVIVPGTQGAVRPVRDLEVSQIVDLRRLRFSEGDKAVTLEVRARGKGVVPELADLLTNVDAALPGYAVSPTGIETRPTLIEQSQSSSSNRFFSFGPTEPPKEGYPEPDENGMYRLPTERTWLVTYTPTGGAIGGEFRLPVLKEGANVKLVSKQYSDMDVVNVTLASIPVNARFWTMWRLAYAGVALVALVLGGVWFSRRKNPVKVRAAHMHLPDRVTPLSVVTTLRRINAELGGGLDSGSRAALVQDITELERKYFGRESTVESNGDLTSVLSRWSSTITRE